jgi:hypothetical protein
MISEDDLVEELLDRVAILERKVAFLERSEVTGIQTRAAAARTDQEPSRQEMDRLAHAISMAEHRSGFSNHKGPPQQDQLPNSLSDKLHSSS